jgi:lipooligosaccharide transport system permease protein
VSAEGAVTIPSSGGPAVTGEDPHARFRLRGVTGVWWRHAVALARVWKVAFTWFFVEPAFVLLAMGLGVGRLVEPLPGHGSYAAFVTPGMIVGMGMFHAIFECAWGAFQRIQAEVLSTQLTTPTTVVELAAGEVLWGGTRAALSTVAIGGLAMALGWLSPTAFPGVLLVAVGVGLEFGAVGLCFAAASPTLSTLTLVFTVVATPLFFFSGSFFPIDVLPGWLQPVAWAAPLTPGVQVARGFAEGSFGASQAASAAYLLALAVAFFPLAAWLLRRRLVK